MRQMPGLRLENLSRRRTLKRKLLDGEEESSLGRVSPGRLESSLKSHQEGFTEAS